MRKAHPVLNLASSNHQNALFSSLGSPEGLPSSIPSSIPTISSLPITPDTAQQEYVAFIDPEEGLLTFSDDQLSRSFHCGGGSCHEKSIERPAQYVKEKSFASMNANSNGRFPLRNFPATNYLSALSEASSDHESIYSQDSACVVFTPKVYGADAPPKSALTFAAIWDPENGMSTYSGTRLLEPASKALSDSGDSDTIRPGSSDPHDSDYYSFMSDTEFYGHPDCEPHLPSRFSTTTTSTSNYIDVDFSSTDRSTDLNVDPMQLQPGDLHPAWVPQIFTLGYNKPSTPKKSKRPDISEPFQLSSSLLGKRPSIRRFTSPPPSPRSSQGHSRGIPPFTRSNTYSPPSSNAKTETGPLFLRRGFSFGSSNPHSDPPPNTTITRLETPSRPTTPSNRPRFTSVLGKMKSQKKDSPEDCWVMVDITSVIRQRIVKESR